MTRRSLYAPADYTKDRALWRGLVEDAHLAVATPTQGSLDRLATQAMKARDLWISAAPYPRGLTCAVLAATALAYGRSGAEHRAALGDLLIAAAGMVDELLTEAGATMPVASAALPSYVTGEAAGRLPYRED